MSKHEYDIIIFYPVDDEKSENYLWAQEFSNYLRNMLNSLLKQAPKILLSPEINSIEESDKISRSDIVSNSELYLFLVSKDSIKNEDYQTTITETFKILEDKHSSIIDKILKIELEPTTEQEQNEILQQVFTHEFFEINQFSKKAKKYDITYGATPPDNFWSKLLDLSSDIQKSLNTDTEVRETEGPWIYLAQPTGDQLNNYDNIKRELQHQGYKVVPGIKLPNKAGQIKEILDDLLPKCDASVHIIGKQYGTYVTNADVSLTELQNRIVNEHLENDKLKKVIFIPQDNRPAEGKQNLFIDRLKKEKSKNTEVILGKQTEFLEILIDVLIKDQEARNTVIPVDTGKTYLIFDNIGENEIQEVKNALNINNEHLILIDYSGNISQNLDRHEDNLRLADNVIVFNAKENLLWLQRHLQDIKKIRGLGKQTEFKNKVILSPAEEFKIHPFLLQDFVSISTGQNDWQNELKNNWKAETSE